MRNSFSDNECVIGEFVRCSFLPLLTDTKIYYEVWQVEEDVKFSYETGLMWMAFFILRFLLYIFSFIPFYNTHTHQTHTSLGSCSCDISPLVGLVDMSGSQLVAQSLPTIPLLYWARNPCTEYTPQKGILSLFIAF